ncbi:hypothetical protein [Vibrio sp. D431a]|uniref:hypothetical protein n=1 Tax=Vibrio sp. D431a TaxID=2837388 RepID=UPI0025579EA9|nr:hypothetical protein [Vibrio sp. D431a]MDK9789889.1 hypothetical protein [Vibrio sp. D431a]
MSFAATLVGSQKTPNCVGVLMHYVALYLTEQCRYIIRSGGAKGADTFFEMGVPARLSQLQEIYMPSPRFPKGNCRRTYVSDFRKRMDAMSVVEKESLHEFWHVLIESPSNNNTVANHLRNVFQVLGDDPIESPIPSRLLVCWTPDGAKEWEETTQRTGGTRTAIRLALRHNIPVFNLARKEDVLRIHEKVKHLYKPTHTPDIQEILRHCAK